MRALNQFTVRKLRESSPEQLDQAIEWVCNSLGFVTKRDQDRTALVILKALIKSARDGEGMTSENLADLAQPSVGAVIYHLKKLMRAGLVVKAGSSYMLKMNTLTGTIDDIQKDIDNTLEDIKYASEGIDEELKSER